MNPTEHLLRFPALVHGWRELLLDTPPAPELRAAFADWSKAVARDFLARADRPPASAEHAELDRWYASATGQQTLAAVTVALWRQMSAHADHAMPAHDARHAMLKVPTASLEHLMAERVEGHARIGALGALLHDHGRWAEERLFGGPAASVLHARMSFLLGRELLAGFELPPLLADQLLLTALRHTSGAEPQDPMPLKLTVSADRDQLFGHEIALRLCHHAPNERGEYRSLVGELPGEAPGLSALDRIEFFFRNRLPGPLFALDAQVAARRAWLFDFLLMAEPFTASRARFADLAADGQGAPAHQGRRLPASLLDGLDLAERHARATALRPAATDPETELAALLDLPRVAPSPAYRALAMGRLARLDDAARERLAGAFRFAADACHADDARQLTFLRALRQREAADAPVAALAGLLINAGWGAAG
ncbi:hypothetical protein [Derxia gummosa]|uniref:Uncharacterized protein n=1 Tax=Derxia gummosa DSM 723 TaxID=1121388 RepID=A0A8B6X5Z3_9BURK|nr:hypothetical protein [Derxia gummosa]